MFFWLERPSQKYFSGLNPTKLTMNALSTLDRLTQVGSLGFWSHLRYFFSVQILLVVPSTFKLLKYGTTQNI